MIPREGGAGLDRRFAVAEPVARLTLLPDLMRAMAFLVWTVRAAVESLRPHEVAILKAPQATSRALPRSRDPRLEGRKHANRF